MKWKKEQLKNVPTSSGIITSDQDRIESYREDTMMRGSPDAVVVARDPMEVSEILTYCNSLGIPVTFCGSQTSMTGSSIANEGLIISTEKMEGIMDITEDDEPCVKIKTGTVVADLQAGVSKAGLFYPVAPTSRDDCRIGSNVITNATGEDSYKYGPVRPYVQELEIILPDGNFKTLSRKPGEKPSFERNRAGYFTGWKNPIDLIIGSEGTLAFVASVTLKLLRGQRNFFSALIPLPSNERALDLVFDLIAGKDGLDPRTIELVDQYALKMMRTADGFGGVSDATGAMIYVKQEYKDIADRNGWLERWYEAMMAYCGKDLEDSLLVALNGVDQERFRLWRHRIPEAANEFGRDHWKDGGGKIGSDWWVPIDKLREMMNFFYEAAKSTGLPFMSYAHIGAGHPHTNLLSRDAKEMKLAHQTLLKCCRKAASLGGGVAGEHGIGKLHTDFMPIQHENKIIDRMKDWKREYDPNWILGRGTIFDV